MSNPSVEGKAVKLSLPVPPRFALRPPLTFDVLGLTRRIPYEPVGKERCSEFIRNQGRPAQH